MLTCLGHSGFYEEYEYFDIADIIYTELKENVFGNSEMEIGEFVSMKFKGIDPYEGVDLDSILTLPETNILWRKSNTFVSDELLSTVLYTYASQFFGAVEYEVYPKYYPKYYDSVFKNFNRVKQADAIAKLFDEETFSNYLSALPYESEMEWLPVIVRFGSDELIEQAIDYILDNEDLKFNNFSKENFIVELLCLSDSEQSALTKEALLYSLDYDCNDCEITEVEDEDLYSFSEKELTEYLRNF